MVKWKVPAWVGAAGAVVSLAAGIAGGNAFGTVLLRALASALLAGAAGFAAQYVVRRFLPGLGAAAPSPPPPGVDILVDEELPLVGGERASAEGGRPAGQRAPGSPADSVMDFEPEQTPAGEPAELPGEASAGPLEIGDFPDLAEPAEQEPSLGRADREPAEGLPELETGVESLEPLEEASPRQARVGPPPDGLPDFDGVEQGLPSRRGRKARELDEQLDDVMQGQDPVSLAKAVRTFLRKDQEG
jgi:hypothetical protein